MSVLTIHIPVVTTEISATTAQKSVLTVYTSVMTAHTNNDDVYMMMMIQMCKDEEVSTTLSLAERAIRNHGTMCGT
jgi:hypothetical protein